MNGFQHRWQWVAGRLGSRMAFCTHPAGLDLTGKDNSGKAPEYGQILPQLRLCSVLIYPIGSFVHFPQPRAGFSPPLFRIHETEKLFYPNCQQTKLISVSLVTGKTIYDREKKWIFAVCFSRLFLMWF